MKPTQTAFGRAQVGAGRGRRSMTRTEMIVRGLDARFDRQSYMEAPYFFTELADISEPEEQAAIDAGLIQAGGIRYTATRA